MFGKNKITKKEKADDADRALNINSMFYTIQGEGPNAGEPAYFIRLQGCNLKCSFCDTEFDSGNPMTVPEIVGKVMGTQIYSWIKPPLVVITGGEPMIQADLPELVNALLASGFRVQIETAGTVWQEGLEIEGIYDDPHFQIVCSPKTGKINKKLEKRLTAYKYVLRHDSIDPVDGLPNRSPETNKSLKLHRPKNFEIPIYVMPCDEHDDEKTKLNERACIHSSMNFGYTLCLQVHKHLGVE